MGWIWWKHVGGWGSCCIWWSWFNRKLLTCVMSSLYLLNSSRPCWEVFPASLTPISWCIYSLSSSSKQLLTKCWCARLHLWVCFLCELRQGRCLMYLVRLCRMSHSVSTCGVCCLWIGSLIIMTVWQIALSVVQGIILLPSGEIREASTKVLLVFSFLH